jgi:protein phosphatase 1G
MGATMSQPDTNMGVSKGCLGNLKWASVSMQGWRVDMEDDHIIMPDFTDNLALFAVFDGHGGPEVAKVAAKLYPNFLKNNEFFKEGDYQRALVSSFEKFDLFMMSEEGKKVFKATNSLKTDFELCAGCTALVALIEKNWVMPEEDSKVHFRLTGYKDLDLRQRGESWEAYQDKVAETEIDLKKEEGAVKDTQKTKKWKVWIANAGDCRGLLLNNKQIAFPLNEEHKPMSDRERRRIERAGGLIVKMRIDENLNLSRALGDFHYKSNFNLPFDQQLIISKPDIYEVVVNVDEDSYLFLGCDGVFEVLSDLDIARQMFMGNVTSKKTKEVNSDDETSIIDEIKEVIREEEKDKTGEENKEEEDNQEGQEGESKSGESLKSSSAKDPEKPDEDKKKEEIEEKEGDSNPTKVEDEGKNKEVDQELEQMVENTKKVLMRTLAKPGQITMGLGFDNMSAICIKLFV